MIDRESVLVGWDRQRMCCKGILNPPYGLKKLSIIASMHAKYIIFCLLLLLQLFFI